MDWSGIFGGLERAGIIDRAAVAGATDSEKMSCVVWTIITRPAYAYSPN